MELVDLVILDVLAFQICSQNRIENENVTCRFRGSGHSCFLICSQNHILLFLLLFMLLLMLHRGRRIGGSEI